MDCLRGIIENFPFEINYWKNYIEFEKLPKKAKYEAFISCWDQISSNFTPDILRQSPEQSHLLEYRWVPLYTDILQFLRETEKDSDKLVQTPLAEMFTNLKDGIIYI